MDVDTIFSTPSSRYYLQLHHNFLGRHSTLTDLKSLLQTLKTPSHNPSLGQTLDLPLSERLRDEVLPDRESRVANPKDELRINVIRQLPRRLRIGHETPAELFHDRRDNVKRLRDSDGVVETDEAILAERSSDILGDGRRLVIEDFARTTLAAQVEVCRTRRGENAVACVGSELDSGTTNRRGTAVDDDHFASASGFRVETRKVQTHVALLVESGGRSIDGERQHDTLCVCDGVGQDRSVGGWDTAVVTKSPIARLVCEELPRVSNHTVAAFEARDARADGVHFTREVMAGHDGPLLDLEAALLSGIDGVDRDGMIADDDVVGAWQRDIAGGDAEGAVGGVYEG